MALAHFVEHLPGGPWLAQRLKPETEGTQTRQARAEWAPTPSRPAGGEIDRLGDGPWHLPWPLVAAGERAARKLNGEPSDQQHIGLDNSERKKIQSTDRW
ncbi:hypothetical protein E2562_003780 [Oryza meyeriana var. granulata]|uniref:Uncharacterized protein n=1 Tax=Oryza meyeriana var. granulata TaxID=110450 RepID=A0A6G1BRF1_9ORYZ|nr:hypothetical protein E2562_003780 [Oryza meyeriana var. granulata]